MEQHTASLKPIAYSYGLYSALLSVVALIITYVLNIDKSWILSGVSIIGTILIFVYGIKAFKIANGNVLSLGQAIKVGLAIAVIAGVITAIYSYFHYEFIYPEFIDIRTEEAYAQMVSQNMSQEQIDQSMELTKMFMNSSFFSLSSLIGSLIFGLITSLIAGLIMKNDK